MVVRTNLKNNMVEANTLLNKETLRNVCQKHFVSEICKKRQNINKLISRNFQITVLQFRKLEKPIENLKKEATTFKESF